MEFSEIQDQITFEQSNHFVKEDSTHVSLSKEDNQERIFWLLHIALDHQES